MSEVSVLVCRGIGWSICRFGYRTPVNLSSIVTLTAEISREPALDLCVRHSFVRGGLAYRHDAAGGLGDYVERQVRLVWATLPKPLTVA